MPVASFEWMPTAGRSISCCRPSETTQQGETLLFKGVVLLCDPVPSVVNVDNDPAYPVPTRSRKSRRCCPLRVRLRQWKYLNDVIEQDHRRE